MGMFDNVSAPSEPCPTCGKTIGGWQTKSGECVLDVLTPEQVPIGGVWYTSCESCRTWVTYHKRPTGFVLEREVETKEQQDARWDAIRASNDR